MKSSMIIPRLLKPGDSIGIVATARRINEGDLDLALEIFQTWGLRVVLGDHIYSKSHPYLAGTEKERASDLQRMIDDPAIRAIVAARGGYGTTQILDDINLEPLLKSPKWIVGFSDITALHLSLLKKGVMSIHGAMPITFPKVDAQGSIDSLGKALMNGDAVLTAPPSPFNREGSARAQVIGGNLSLLADSLGTRSEPDTQDTILFIEEIDEYLYKIDRLLTQLRRAGKFSKLRGLLVGHMTDLKDSGLSYGKVYQEIVLNALREFDFPIAFQVPSGHEHPNHAFFHGGSATMTISPTGTSVVFAPLREEVE